MAYSAMMFVLGMFMEAFAMMILTLPLMFLRTRAALDALGAAVALVFFRLLFWQGLHAAMSSWQIKERTLSVVRIPIYPAKFSILVGVTVMMAQLLIDLVESLRHALGTSPRRA